MCRPSLTTQHPQHQRRNNLGNDLQTSSQCGSHTVPQPKTEHSLAVEHAIQKISTSADCMDVNWLHQQHELSTSTPPMDLRHAITTKCLCSGLTQCCASGCKCFLRSTTTRMARAGEVQHTAGLAPTGLGILKTGAREGLRSDTPRHSQQPLPAEPFKTQSPRRETTRGPYLVPFMDPHFTRITRFVSESLIKLSVISSKSA